MRAQHTAEDHCPTPATPPPPSPAVSAAPPCWLRPCHACPAPRGGRTHGGGARSAGGRRRSRARGGTGSSRSGPAARTRSAPSPCGDAGLREGPCPADGLSPPRRRLCPRAQGQESGEGQEGGFGEVRMIFFPRRKAVSPSPGQGTAPARGGCSETTARGVRGGLGWGPCSRQSSWGSWRVDCSADAGKQPNSPIPGDSCGTLLKNDCGKVSTVNVTVLTICTLAIQWPWFHSQC